jgi:YidC/Oxa1 family membrane protein insertase
VAGNEAGGAMSPLEPRWRRSRPAEEVEIVRETVLGWFESVLSFLHGIFEPIFGIHSWGWAIIALTLIVRIALLPLAIKQTRSMRAMQALQPQMKELQKKYKVDRELLKKDPEQYKAKKAKLNEEMMGLYQREGANPAASCLPLLAQAPIFLALFWTLRGMEELTGAEFYFFTTVGEGGLEQLVSQAGWPGWLLILLMSGTMFWSQKQMMARNAATAVADNPMAQQQKILLYVMPVFLAFISFNFPMGILLYWVTTNIWQVAQQAIILREVQHEVETGEIANKPGGAAAKQTRKRTKPDPDAAKDEGGSTRRSPGASSGRKPSDGASPSDDGVVPADGASEGPTAPLDRSNGRSDEPPGGPADPIERPRKRDHLPKRGGGTRP